MMKISNQATAVVATLLAISTLLPRNSDATVVEFQTVMGTFEVNLYDNATPATVTNFLDYVNNSAYTSSIVHRSVPGFIIQGGGFNFGLAWPATAITANPAVVNEPEFSNVRGTIAMAKIGGNPNSATSQWFFNLADNSANLDDQNGGFTVFGEVVGTGMDIVDAIAALSRFSLGGAFDELPLLNAPSGDPDASNLVIVSAVIVIDTTVNTAAGLNPPPNTLINQPPPAPAPAPPSGGGGSLSIFALFTLAVVRRYRVADGFRRQA